MTSDKQELKKPPKSAKSSPRHPPTRNDVAAHAGVSSAVVSYVLNNGPRSVSEPTRERVLHAVQELGYRPNHIARSLRGSKSHTIGLIAPTLDNPVYGEISMGLTDVFSDEAYLLMVCDSEESPQNDSRYADLLASNQADGVLLIPTAPVDDTLAVLSRANIPAVVLERHVPTTPSVVLDPVEAGRLATDHLIALGHTRIAMIVEPPGERDSWKRQEGFRAAHHKAGLPVEENYVVTGYGISDGVNATAKLLDLKNPPTAVVAHNDIMAIGVIHAASQRGIAVPRELSVVGVDDLEVARFMNPPLTTVSFGKRELGHIAARKLLKLISGAEVNPLTVLPAKLLVRESTSTPPPASSS